MTLRTLPRFVIVALVSLTLMPALALAADPPLEEAPIIPVIDFESAPPGYVLIEPVDFMYWPPAGAYWGRITDRAKTGSYGLWCAGNVASNWTTFGGKYPTPNVDDPGLPYVGPSAGYATISVPELSNYYSSRLTYSYTMPTLGTADANSFNPMWYASDATSWKDTHPYRPLTAEGSWRQEVWTLSSPSNLKVNLSRRAGVVRFQWADNPDDVGNPKTGEGVTIDDVAITGYKYGPPRELAASAGGSSVTLGWLKPYTSTVSTDLDGRTLTYRVWRAEQGVTPVVWTELTVARLVTPAFEDTTVVRGKTYRYLVQAWDTAAGSGYGASSETTIRVPDEAVDVSITAPAAVAKGTSASLTYRVTNTGGGTLANISVTDNWSGTSPLSPVASLAPGAWADVARVTPSLTASTTVNVDVSASGGAVTSSDAKFIQVVDPRLSISLETTPGVVGEGDSALVTYIVGNAGDIALVDVVVSDGLGQVHTTIPALAPGEQQAFQRAVPGSTSGYVTGSAEGSFVLEPGGTAYPTGTVADSVWVDVVPARLSGTDRIATAIQASQKAFPNGLAGGTVVLASGYAWPDALSASALAGAVGGPLMLVRQGELPSAVLTEIQRLGATSAYIVGGTAAVSGAVDTALTSHGITVTRAQGADRYATAVDVATKVVLETGEAPETVFLATGANFPDALAASSLSAALRAPILLTRRTELPTSVAGWLSTNTPARVVVCGGTAAVDDGVATYLASSTFGSPEVVRKAGAGRYETARDLLVYGGQTLLGVAPDGVFIATGTNYPDALAGGALAGAGYGTWRPLMLTTPDVLHTAAIDYIQSQPTIGYASVLGGPSAVSEAVLQGLAAVLP